VALAIDARPIACHGRMSEAFLMPMNTTTPDESGQLDLGSKPADLLGYDAVIRQDRAHRFGRSTTAAPSLGCRGTISAKEVLFNCLRILLLATRQARRDD